MFADILSLNALLRVPWNGVFGIACGGLLVLYTIKKFGQPHTQEDDEFAA